MGTHPTDKRNGPDLQETVRHLDTLADLVVDRLVLRFVGGLQDTRVESRNSGPLPDDAVVHQDSAPMDRDLYLRMARRGEFASFKDGKKVFAFWGEVRTALAARMAKAQQLLPQKSDAKEGLNGLRASLGLETKGR